MYLHACVKKQNPLHLTEILIIDGTTEFHNTKMTIKTEVFFRGSGVQREGEKA